MKYYVRYRYRLSGDVHVKGFEAVLPRALWVIAMGVYVDIVDEWEE